MYGTVNITVKCSRWPNSVFTNGRIRNTSIVPIRKRAYSSCQMRRMNGIAARIVSPAAANTKALNTNGPGRWSTRDTNTGTAVRKTISGGLVSTTSR